MHRHADTQVTLMITLGTTSTSIPWVAPQTLSDEHIGTMHLTAANLKAETYFSSLDTFTFTFTRTFKIWRASEVG